MLDVHRLRIFRSVVASGSIQAAAANLGYTPSAVSQHVTALQKETGLALVTRVGRGIEPTAAGRTLAEQVDGLISRLGEVESMVGDLRAGRTGTLSVSYFASVGSAWMPHVVRAMMEQFPDVRLDLSLREELPDNPVERSDIQIVVERNDLSSVAGARVHHLLDEPYVAVVHQDHPQARAARIELADLAMDQWVDNDFAQGWCRRIVVDACRAAGFSPPFQVEAHDYQTAIAFVATGIGITMVPRIAASGLPAEVRAIPVTSPTPVRSLYAVVQTAIEATPPARLVLDVLRTQAAAGSTVDAA